MIARIFGRYLVMALVRTAWHNRDRIGSHGGAYEVELATALRTAVEESRVRRLAFGGYRAVMWLLVAASIALGAIALVLAVALWQLHPLASLFALVVVIPAIPLVLWRLVWGAPLDWLNAKADLNRKVPLGELPQRLRALAKETRTIEHVPARMADDLDELADRASIEPGTGG